MNQASRRLALAASLMSLMTIAPVAADSSSPRLAAYYDRFLALCGEQIYQWQDADPPRPGPDSIEPGDIRQVGVGRANHYALRRNGELLSWTDAQQAPAVIMRDIQSFHAGRSGVFAIRDDASLWQLETRSWLGFGETLAEKPQHIADDVVTAAVGDSANYYVHRSGELFVKGLAHRGQYGDGRLQTTEHFVRTASAVAQVVAHTGHALIRKRDGSVWGTGGNIYGPLGAHGYGDKADSWGRIADNMRAIATGSSHSVGIDGDRNLWIWGRDESLDPKRVLRDVTAVAASTSSTIALAQGFLWQWERGAIPKKIRPCN